MTEYILLGFLMQKNMTGYDMKRKMSLSTSYFIDASYGSIYPSLKKLEQKGLIASKETVENGKLKKGYSINEQGKAEFIKWLGLPIVTSKSEFSSALAKIFFFRYLPTDHAAALIGQYVRDMENYQESLSDLKKQVEKKADEFELCTLDFGLDYYAFIIKWYKKRLDKTEQKNNKE